MGDQVQVALPAVQEVELLVREVLGRMPVPHADPVLLGEVHVPEDHLRKHAQTHRGVARPELMQGLQLVLESPLESSGGQACEHGQHL